MENTINNMDTLKAAMELAKQQRSEVNKALRKARKDVVEQYVYDIVRNAKLAQPGEKLAWTNAPWGAKLVQLLIGEPVIAGTKMKHGEVNYARIHAYVMAAPIK